MVSVIGGCAQSTILPTTAGHIEDVGPVGCAIGRVPIGIDGRNEKLIRIRRDMPGRPSFESCSIARCRVGIRIGKS